MQGLVFQADKIAGLVHAIAANLVVTWLYLILLIFIHKFIYIYISMQDKKK